MANKVPVEALEFAKIQVSIKSFVDIDSLGKIYFVYDPKGWRFRILLVRNEKLTQCFYGELFDQKKPSNTTQSKVMLLLQQASQHKNIFLYGIQYRPTADKWFLADETVSLDDFKLVIQDGIPYVKQDEVDVLMDFAQQHAVLVFKNNGKRPALREKAKGYIVGRSLGCCEFENCADPLFINTEGVFGNYGTLAHIVAASSGGPRAEAGISEDAITDPENFLYLCEKHHRLIDKTDVETYTIERLRNMLVKRKYLANLLSMQLKYEETIPIIFEGDILEIKTEISKREVLDAVISKGMIFTENPIRPIKLQATRSEANSYSDYWNNLFSTNDSEIIAYKRLLRDLGNTKLSIFPLATMPFIFLMGYMTGESQPIQLFHRNRARGWVFLNEDQDKNIFDINSFTKPKGNLEEVVILLAITATIDEDRLPLSLKALPRITLTCSTAEIGQDVFNTQGELERYKEKAQQAVNIAIDTYKAKKIHIISVAPAVAIFILGQKFQRRSSPPITMYQIEYGEEAYPILCFNKNVVSLFWDKNKRLDI